MSRTIMKNISILGSIVAGGFSSAATWPIMSGKLGFSARNTFVNVTTLTYSIWKHYILQDLSPSKIKPSAVIAGIPLPSVDELSHAISDRETRYRAHGGVFLAHQSGGNESLRIVGKAWGTSRFLFLNMLDLLFLWGSSSTIDVFTQATNRGFNNFPSIAVDIQEPYMNRVFQVSKDPWEKFNQDNLNGGFQEQHMTFPVLTKNRVYISMFIETYSWRQRIDKENRKMIEYVLFFRKYEPPPEYEFARMRVPTIDPDVYREVKVYKQKSINTPIIYAMWKGLTEIMATLSINREAFDVGNAYDWGQQFIMNYFGVNVKDGRIPGIIEQRGYF